MERDPSIDLDGTLDTEPDRTGSLDVDPDSGSTEGRFKIIRELGTGGVASVYEVIHTQLGTRHALKILDIAHPELKARAIEEGRAQALLVHDNIVHVTDIVTIRGRPSLLMDFVSGPTLGEWLAHNRPALAEVYRIFRGILRGVDAAHRAGFVHRDLKPDNVLLDTTGAQPEPRIADFGLVKLMDPPSGHEALTRPGTMMGTPEYMSPEQIRDTAAVDHRTDLFALGCILYEMVTGSQAFAADSAVLAFSRIIHGDYVDPQSLRPDLPDGLASVIRELLAVEATDRIQTCHALMERLYGPQSRPAWFPAHDPDPHTVLTPPSLSTPRARASLRPRHPAPTPSNQLPRWLAVGLGFLFVTGIFALCAVIGWSLFLG